MNHVNGCDNRHEDNKAGDTFDTQSCVGAGCCTEHRPHTGVLSLAIGTGSGHFASVLDGPAAGGFVAGLLVALLVKNDAKSKPETGWTANIVLPGKGGTSTKGF